MMGALADGVLEAGGRIRSVLIEGFLPVAHPEVQAVTVAGSMRERKHDLLEGSQACVALPGGIGTFDEIFEVLSLTQLQITVVPLVLLDHGRYFQPLLELLDRTIETGYVRAADRSLFEMVEKVEQVVPALRNWRVPQIPDKKG